MKRICLLLLSLCMLLCMPLTAAATSTTITVEVPEPDYHLSIPSDLEIDYQAENCTLGVPTVTESSGFKEGMYLKVAVSHCGKFTCPDVSTVIPFVFSMATAEGSSEWSSGDCLIFDRTESGSVSTTGHASGGAVPTGMIFAFSAEDWEAAYPGKYTTVITYTASIVTP